jgi:hypothetical protein
VLRRDEGTLHDGEPSVWSDEEGEFVRCPKCHGRIPWPVDRNALASHDKATT